MGSKLYTKTDTYENWQKAKNFIPKKGELIFYSDIEQIKIGDGATNVNELDFIGQSLNMEYNEEGSKLILSWK